MTTLHKLFLALKPHDIRLASHDGRILAIVDNYTEVFDTHPKPTDGITQVFLAEVREDEVVQQQEGTRSKLLLWKGDAGSRSRPQDKLSLPVVSLVEVGGAEELPSQMQLAAKAFSELPDGVRLALSLMNSPSNVIAELPQGVVEIKKWADQVLTKHAGKA